MDYLEKNQAYMQAEKQLDALLKNEDDVILKMATINCILKTELPYYFWVGFYLVRGQELLVGPYQGTLGCLHIPFGKGVCGTAATEQRTQIVEDVHAHKNHIACDSRSSSEIVVPVFDKDKKLIAVFDVDSTELGSFDEMDKMWLEKILGKIFTQ